MNASFRVGILGAGLGSRLKDASGSKPLALLAGSSLLELLAGQFRAAGASEIFCALRAEQFPAEKRQQLPRGISFLFADTESSLHTLAELVRFMGAAKGPVLFSMADTVMLPGDLRSFVAFCAALPPGENAVLSTPFVDDEKPLWVKTDGKGRVLSFGAEKGEAVTSGMYFLQPEAMALALEEVAAGTHKMRNFLSSLARSGHPIKSFVVAKTIDVDHPSDLEKAAAFLRDG